MPSLQKSRSSAESVEERPADIDSNMDSTDTETISENGNPPVGVALSAVPTYDNPGIPIQLVKTNKTGQEVVGWQQIVMNFSPSYVPVPQEQDFKAVWLSRYDRGQGKALA